MVLSALSLLADGLPTATATQNTITVSGDSGVFATAVDPSLPTSTAAIADNYIFITKYDYCFNDT